MGQWMSNPVVRGITTAGTLGLGELYQSRLKDKRSARRKDEKQARLARASAGVAAHNRALPVGGYGPGAAALIQPMTTPGASVLR